MPSAFSFQQWYAANGERHNAKRKDRYHTDEEYRAKVLQQNQASRAKRREEAKKQRKSSAPPKSRLERVLQMEVDGVMQRVYTIGSVARQLGCSLQTLRQWERKGIIPETPLRAEHGSSRDRLYTEAMVEEIRAQLVAGGRLGSKRTPQMRPEGLKRLVRFKDRRTEEVQLFLIGVLAKIVNRNVILLKQMEQRGVLPRTPFTTSRVDRRLYTQAMMDTVKDAFERFGNDLRDNEAKESFHDHIISQWTAQKVMGAVLVEAVPKKKGTADGQAN